MIYIGLKWLGCLLSAYLIFALVSSTLPHMIAKPVSGEAKQTLTGIAQQTQSPGVRDKIVLVQDMAQAFNVRIEMLRAAQSSIDFVCHIVLPGQTTEAFLGELIQAAERGVTVRVLLDGKAGGMSAEIRRAFQALEQHENITCRSFNPVRLARPWEWHTLLHDKFILVDGRYLLLGGRNLEDRFFGPQGYKGRLTDDWEALVFGNGAVESVLPQAEQYMALLWQHERTKPMFKRHPDFTPDYQVFRKAAVLLQEQSPALYCWSLADYWKRAVPATITLLHNPVHTGKKEPYIGYRLREVALEASESILIQTPYSTANRYLLEAFAKAGENAQVTILTNSMAGSPNFPAFSNYYYNRQKFIDTGIMIYEYQSADSIHGKAMVFDGRYSALGSLNLDDRSLYIDTETMLLIDSPAFAAVLTEAIENYIGQSLKVGPDNRYEKAANHPEAVPVGRGKRMVMYLASLPSRLLQFLI